MTVSPMAKGGCGAIGLAAACRRGRRWCGRGGHHAALSTAGRHRRTDRARPPTGTSSRRRDCQSAAPPSSFKRCFNGDGDSRSPMARHQRRQQQERAPPPLPPPLHLLDTKTTVLRCTRSCSGTRGGRRVGTAPSGWVTSRCNSRPGRRSCCRPGCRRLSRCLRALVVSSLGRRCFTSLRK